MGRCFAGDTRRSRLIPMHIVQVCRYIHLNPVVAGLTPKAEAWRWSSAAAYGGTVRARPWLKSDVILELFRPGDAVAAYRDFMAAAPTQGRGISTRSWVREPLRQTLRV